MKPTSSFAVAPLIFAVTLFTLNESTFALQLRLADWNVANRPNTAADSTDMSSVFSYIGSQATTAAARPFDILALVETDTASVVTTDSVANSAYGTTTYQSVASTPDGGSDRTGLVYNSATVQLLGSQELTVGLTHHILRGQFRPVGTNGSEDFYYYAVHLKSGSGTSIASTRLLEAQVLRTDADTLGSSNVIFGGDINWQSSDELGANPVVSAWDALTNPGGNGQLFDPINMAGNWHGNAAFKAIDTNDPGASMDDRFDVQLLSSELFDHTGLDYISGSYTVVGNNGTHTLNQPITTGTGAPVDVLNALVRFSDHLPVYLDYSYDVPEPAGASVLIAAAFTWTRRRRSVARQSLAR